MGAHQVAAGCAHVCSLCPEQDDLFLLVLTRSTLACFCVAWPSFPSQVRRRCLHLRICAQAYSAAPLIMECQRRMENCDRMGVRIVL
ncbi:hypothetical protein DFP72DRAFT_1040225 [Ephemerocybe angulata]|uniref:Uncharacterized protein n=1 Tax=Ephemerocybe angulata TaxID=980116 RepID=A0A8H6IFB7_9AGAR|nr:hypothetical protein DFP72DRAFT_1040225 [Tulosesus angulatus]